MKATHLVRRWALAAMALGLGACQPTEEFEGDDALAEQSQPAVSATVMRQRSDGIKAALVADPYVDNPLLWAGIANTETDMAFCYGELAPYQCAGPYSADCGGPILAGYWDGPCSDQQGGLGMFQFDSGTHTQTLAEYGSGILTVQGSTARAVQFILDRAWNSPYTPYFATRQDMYNWINNIRVGGASWDLWLGFLANSYNGATWGTSDWAGIKVKYDNKTRAMLNLYGESYWYGTTPPPPPPPGGCSPEGGLFCGGNGVAGDPSFLYVCKGGVPVVKQVCANGCNRAPAGQADSCLAGSAAPKTCSCAGGAYKNGSPIPQSLTYCGFRTCGSDNNLYECRTNNQWANTGVACGGSCSCSGGAHLNGTQISAANTSCHMEVCGGGNTFYECLGTSWTAVSGSYCRMN